MSKMNFSSSQSEKISVAIPVFIYGCRDDGNPFQERTRTLVVDVSGGLIELESALVNGLRVLVVNENTDEEVECNVVVSKKIDNGKAEVRIAFNKPSPTFWGVEFTSEECNLDQSQGNRVRHFINSGTAPVTAEIYRRLMGRVH
jgi:hypothetical protein